MKNNCNDRRCFGNVGGACSILNSPEYETGHCPFSKTPEELEAQQKRCKLRLIAKYGKKVQN